MTQYVLGFMFGSTNVLLIEKARPDWQRGHFNGIGGRVEDNPDADYGETILDAMVREFWEETHIQTDPTEWHHFLVIGKAKWESHCFACFQPHVMTATNSDPTEPVSWHSLYDLPSLVLPNLRWLVPMAWQCRNIDYHVRNGVTPR